MTGSSGSSPSSPNTKPEPRYHQCCCLPNSGLSGPSCALVLLPMPDSKQRSANCVVKLCKIQIQEISTLPTAFTQIWMINLVHLSTNPCAVLLSLISPFHLRLALSGSIFSYLPSHDWFLRILTILTKHQAWAPSGPMLLVCRFRFVRVELCFSPSANAWQQTKICKLRGEMMQNSNTRNLNASYRILLILPLILTYHVVSSEMKRTSFNSFRSEW